MGTAGPIAVVLLLVLTGCGGGGTEPQTRPDEPAATKTVTETPEPTCTPPAASYGILLARSWGRVLASRGASDHSHYAAEFSDDTAELSEDFEDGNCSRDRRLAVALELNYEATVVKTNVSIGGEVDYTRVPPVGDKLMKLMGLDDKFAAPNSR